MCVYYGSFMCLFVRVLLLTVFFQMEASSPSHASLGTGGTTTVAPRIHCGFVKSTNPQFNVLTWLGEVPIGATVITSIYERVESEGDAPTVTFCHGTARINPWSLNLDVKESLAHASGCWIDLPPQTKIENDRGPVLSVTCKVMEVRTTESGGEGVQPGGLGVVSGGLGVASGGQEVWSSWQAMQGIASAPPEEAQVEPPVQEVAITCDDGFKDMSAMSAAESTTCCFYIPRAIMERTSPNLWGDLVKGDTHPHGLPRSPLMNYHVMAMGWDWKKCGTTRASLCGTNQGR